MSGKCGGWILVKKIVLKLWAYKAFYPTNRSCWQFTYFNPNIRWRYNNSKMLDLFIRWQNWPLVARRQKINISAGWDIIHLFYKDSWSNSTYQGISSNFISTEHARVIYKLCSEDIFIRVWMRSKSKKGKTNLPAIV